MTQSQQNSGVGDTKAPTLGVNAECLRCTTDQAQQIQGDGAAQCPPINKGANLGTCLDNKAKKPAPTTCVQKIWFSFFFDGTGNNMDADLGTLKHSNVVRLYRSHQGVDPAKEPGKVAPDGTYRLYIPGVGTYFKEVSDNGASTSGLAFALMGDKRLTWAKKQFDAALQPHIKLAHNPEHAIVEINIAAFGFSRGAAEARAFVHRFVNDDCTVDGSGALRLKAGNYKTFIRFVGIYDTVASVGQPMSANTVGKIDVIIGVSALMSAREESGTRPRYIAFSNNEQAAGTAGADPAPGMFNGHLAWGGDMQIPKVVEEVRHFIAAHEIRNSFPVDSISVLENGHINKPPHFHETVYPGVHSDVGGSYRPKEQGKSDTSQLKIGLIALNDMYEFALAKGVPMKPRTAWESENVDDFKVVAQTIDVYNYYLSKVGASGSLGDLFNANMALYFAWRFRSIHRKLGGNHDEADRIKKDEADFETDGEKLKKQIASLQQDNDAAAQKVQQANAYLDYTSTQYQPNMQQNIANAQQQVATAKDNQAVAQDRLLRAQAQKDALPSFGKLEPMLEMYDKQLMVDAQAIYGVYAHPLVPDPKIRTYLRPHYKAMMDAYENEFIQNKGLKDPKIIDFFDNYVHDSLAGFAKDATLPSDPRVIYLGGNEKYQYAFNDQSGDSSAANVA